MIQMRHDNLLVERLPTPEQTESGLYILGQEKPQLGRVISCGPKCFDISPGQTVMFGKFTGSPIGNDQLILKYKDLLITIEEI
jgi:co-chaperonin GroES (HSP10)